MKTNIKKGLISFSIIAVISFSAAAVFSHGWGGYGHMGPGYGNGTGWGHMGPGYMNGPAYGSRDYLKNEIGLTDKQQEKIFKINSKYNEKYFKNRGNPDKIYALRTEHRKEIEKVLTKSQREKFFGNRNYVRNRGWRGCSW